jgi:hypothetical protein
MHMVLLMLQMQSQPQLSIYCNYCNKHTYMVGVLEVLQRGHYLHTKQPHRASIYTQFTFHATAIHSAAATSQHHQALQAIWLHHDCTAELGKLLVTILQSSSIRSSTIVYSPIKCTASTPPSLSRRQSKHGQPSSK